MRSWLGDERVERSRFVEGADPVEGTRELRFGHQRPQRIAAAPRRVERAAPVEVRIPCMTASLGTNRPRGLSPALGEEPGQLCGVRVTPTHCLDRVGNQRCVPPATAELLVGARVDHRRAAGGAAPARTRRAPDGAVAGRHAASPEDGAAPDFTITMSKQASSNGNPSMLASCRVTGHPGVRSSFARATPSIDGFRSHSIDCAQVRP